MEPSGNVQQQSFTYNARLPIMASSSPTQADRTREFTKILENLRYKHGIRELFADWVEIAAHAIHQEPYHLGLVMPDEAFHEVEEKYLEAVKKYDREELDAFAELLGITKMALTDSTEDFLGQLYMQLEISQDRSGEFFTPFPVSVMMAKMTLGDVSDLLSEKGFITLAEPACGAGGMLIAAAKVIQEAGYHPSESLFFEATDVSKLCADMAYLQTSILGLPGIVRHGNTLSMDTWSSRFTPICRVYPSRTNRFLDSLYLPVEELPIPTNDNALQQAEEPETAPVEAEAYPNNLADIDESYVQGRLF